MPSALNTFSISSRRTLPDSLRSNFPNSISRYIASTFTFGAFTRNGCKTTANPAFDVTPARLITGIATERGLVPPTRLAGLFAEVRR